jgi:hypothetical protein
MTLARAANRLFDRGDFAWFDLLALSGRDVDAAIRNLPTDQLEAVLETREFNQQIERSL